MQDDPNKPSIPGGGPPTNTADPAEQWYQNVILAHPEKYDTGISKQQWLNWYPLWNGTGFNSSKVDKAGNPIQGGVDKPDDCPPGTTAYGQNQCLPTDDPHVLGIKPGQQAGAPQSQTPAAPQTLQDVLMQMFQQRSQLFGYDQGRTPGTGQFAGSMSVDQNGLPLPQAPNLAGQALSGGGLVWGPAGTDLSAYAPPPAAPAGGGGGAAPQEWSAGNGTMTPSPAYGPLAGGYVPAPSGNQSGLPAPGSGQRIWTGFGGPGVDRSQPANVSPTGAPTSLSDVLNGSASMRARRPGSPLTGMFM